MNIAAPRNPNQEKAMQLVGISEASKQLSISHITLRRWDKAGKLKAIRLTPNGKRFYKKSDIGAIIKTQTFVTQQVCTNSPKAKMLLKDFGIKLETEEAGKKAWLQIQNFLQTLGEESAIEIDFTGVETLLLEWADEFLVPLHQKYGDHLSLTNVENLAHITILEIIGLY